MSEPTDPAVEYIDSVIDKIRESGLAAMRESDRIAAQWKGLAERRQRTIQKLIWLALTETVVLLILWCYIQRFRLP